MMKQLKEYVMLLVLNLDIKICVLKMSSGM